MGVGVEAAEEGQGHELKNAKPGQAGLGLQDQICFLPGVATQQKHHLTT